MMLTACTDRKPVKREAEKIDTIPVMVMQIKK